MGAGGKYWGSPKEQKDIMGVSRQEGYSECQWEGRRVLSGSVGVVGLQWMSVGANGVQWSSVEANGNIGGQWRSERYFVGHWC